MPNASGYGTGMAAEGARILDALAENGFGTLYPETSKIAVGTATCGISAGSEAVLEGIHEAARESGCPLDVSTVGCYGLCWAEPLVTVRFPGRSRALFSCVAPDQAGLIVNYALEGAVPPGLEGQLIGFQSADKLTLTGEARQLQPDSATLGRDVEELPFLKAQHRLVMGNCGLIDPESIEEYVAAGGYRGLHKALFEMSPLEVIEAVEESGLRGRGGAGFPAGRKWRLVAEDGRQKKYFVVNADEGDPGAYMDRGLLESDPHRVIEGLAIGAYATGAHEAVVFIRSEYSRAIGILRNAIDAARDAGVIGEGMLGAPFPLDIRIVKSAGAFICGEGTAMVAALDGFACEPRVRPPYSTECGIEGQPTCINNVETLANVPGLITQGATAFKSVGTAESPGTKLFTLVGAVERGGLIEVPLGTEIRTVVEGIGGAEGARAVQIGGPSGAILPLSATDDRPMEISFEGLDALGGIMGSGGMIILGESQCIVDTVLYCLRFAVRESCGKCTPCRDGLAACLAIVESVAAGRGGEGCLDDLAALSDYVRESSLCSFGRMVPALLLSSLAHFREEFEEHLEGRCRACVCTELIRFEIDQVKCQGERCCLQACPGNAIKGPFGKPGHVVQRLCTKCWMCTTRCPYDAIRAVS